MDNNILQELQLRAKNGSCKRAERLDMDDLIGKLCVDVQVDRDENEIEFVFVDGTTAKMYHQQDCCEGVEINDINGDFADLIAVPLSVFEERTSAGESDYGTSTWTFCTLRTIKGSIDIRWFGESNGYYSESVDVWVSAPAVPLSAHQQLELRSLAQKGGAA